LNWLASTINQLPVGNYWQALARESYLDDLAWQQRALTNNIVSSTSKNAEAGNAVESWLSSNQQAVARVAGILANLQAETQPDYSMFSVALRELLNLAQSTAHGS